MKIRIGRFEFTECWDGVLYKNLSAYPAITEWELQSLCNCIAYEAANGRACEIEADESIQRELEEYRKEYESGRRVPVPQKLTECTACPKYRGCLTDLVCHTASAEDAISILKSGRLLSAVRARGLDAAALKAEARNAANDPEDFFHYVMFAWGNCQAGDRLVVERQLGRFPNNDDLKAGFIPGVRFFFRYDELSHHPRAVFDGVHPVKVQDEVVLADNECAIIVPEMHLEAIETHVPEALTARVHYLSSDDLDIWEWSAKAYEFARGVLSH